MTTLAYIAFFGALGCVARYFLSGFVYDRMGWGFPWGTLAVNTTGAFIIGLIMELALRGAEIPGNLRIGLITGFLGGLTTFSTFSYETFRLIETGRFLTAFCNILLSVSACLVCTWLGILAGKTI